MKIVDSYGDDVTIIGQPFTWLAQSMMSNVTQIGMRERERERESLLYVRGYQGLNTYQLASKM